MTRYTKCTMVQWYTNNTLSAIFLTAGLSFS